MRRASVYTDLNQNKPQKALKTLTHLLQRSPNNFEYHVLKALCHIRLHDLEEASSAIDLALPLCNDPSYLPLFEAALKPLGRNADIIALYDRFYGSDTKDPVVLEKKAMMSIRSSNYMEASKLLLTLYKAESKISYYFGVVACNLLEARSNRKPKLRKLALSLLSKILPKLNQAEKRIALKLFRTINLIDCLKVLSQLENDVDERDLKWTRVVLMRHSEGQSRMIANDCLRLIELSWRDEIPNWLYFQELFKILSSVSNDIEIFDDLCLKISNFLTSLDPSPSIQHRRTLSLASLMFEKQLLIAKTEGDLNLYISNVKKHCFSFIDDLNMMVDDFDLLISNLNVVDISTNFFDPEVFNQCNFSKFNFTKKSNFLYFTLKTNPDNIIKFSPDFVENLIVEGHFLPVSYYFSLEKPSLALAAVQKHTSSKVQNDLTSEESGLLFEGVCNAYGTYYSLICANLDSFLTFYSKLNIKFVQLLSTSFLLFSSFKFRCDFEIMLSSLDQILKFAQGFVSDEGPEALSRSVINGSGVHKSEEFLTMIDKVKGSLALRRAHYWKLLIDFLKNSSEDFVFEKPDVPTEQLIEIRDYSIPKCLLQSNLQSNHSCNHFCPNTMDNSIGETLLLEQLLLLLSKIVKREDIDEFFVSRYLEQARDYSVTFRNFSPSVAVDLFSYPLSAISPKFGSHEMSLLSLLQNLEYHQLISFCFILIYFVFPFFLAGNNRASNFHQDLSNCVDHLDSIGLATVEPFSPSLDLFVENNVRSEHETLGKLVAYMKKMKKQFNK
ncbi:hypothetical protein P9112_007085 [Eukaryota sp. TZLM1-RC]